MKYKLVLFDFDYTLADSSAGIVLCFQHVLKRNGYPDISDEAIKRTIGKTLEESFSILTGVTDSEELSRWKSEYVKAAHTYMTVNTFIYDHTLPVLKSLKSQGVKVGIISTKFRYRIAEFFENYLPSDWFDVIIGGEDVTRHKPDPQGIHIALEKLDISLEEVLYVGDSTVDAQAAVSAGVDFVGVTTGMTTEEELAAFPNQAILADLSAFSIA